MMRLQDYARTCRHSEDFLSMDLSDSTAGTTSLKLEIVCGGLPPFTTVHHRTVYSTVYHR